MRKNLKKSIKKYCFSGLCGFVSCADDTKGKKTLFNGYGRPPILKNCGTEIVDDSLMAEKSAAAELLCLAVADRVTRELFCFVFLSRAADLPGGELVGVKSDISVFAGQYE